MTDNTDHISNQPAMVAEPKAQIALCYGCENPFLLRDLPEDSAAMQCPRCGTYLRPKDINTYVLEEDDHE